MLELAAKTSGFDVILINITEPRHQLIEALDNIKGWAVDGIISIVPVKGLAFEEMRAITGETPVVQIGSVRASGTPSVTIDETYGTEQLVSHLIDLGHTRFAEISGPLDWFSAQVRHQATLDTLAARGLDAPVSDEANWTVSGGYRAAKRLLEAGHDFTALVVANDSMALGAIRALHEAGLSVPRDVSVVGFDDIPEAAYFAAVDNRPPRNLIQLGWQVLSISCRSWTIRTPPPSSEFCCRA